MIKTSMQLKALIRNKSNKDSNKAQMLMRNFIMERFLERISWSKYKSSFILKGGILVSALVGTDARSTMDIDTTVMRIDLKKDNLEKIIREICEVDVNDGAAFNIIDISEIMQDFDYPGVRITLEGLFDTIKQIIRIDISTNDIITPSSITLVYNLSFEDRCIELMSYNIETLLAEKLETIIARGITNTRMRDFYDISIIWDQKNDEINIELLKEALFATSRKRGTIISNNNVYETITSIQKDGPMRQMWDNYVKTSYYIIDFNWDDATDKLLMIFNMIFKKAMIN